MVELAQVRRRHLHGTHRRDSLRQIQRFDGPAVVDGLPPHPLQDRLDVEAELGSVLLDGPPNLLQGMLLQQLQDADVVLGSPAGPVLPFQGRAQFVEESGQLPAAKDVGMIQRRRPTIQPVQVMQRIEDLLVPAIAARMGSDHFPAQHDVDPLDVDLDRHGLESGRTRHAVAVGLVADHLVFIDLGRLADIGIESLFRE